VADTLYLPRPTQADFDAHSRGLGVLASQSQLDAIKILLSIKLHRVHPDARKFILNASLWAMGMSGMGRPPVPGYESEPGVPLPPASTDTSESAS
jgi:hypothetical protein